MIGNSNTDLDKTFVEMYGYESCNTGELELIPRQCQFASDVQFVTQVKYIIFVALYRNLKVIFFLHSIITIKRRTLHGSFSILIIDLSFEIIELMSWGDITFSDPEHGENQGCREIERGR